MSENKLYLNYTSNLIIVLILVDIYILTIFDIEAELTFRGYTL